MDGFGTSTELMAKAGGDVLTAQQNVQSELNALRGKMEAVRGVWRGEAYAQFAALMVRWDAGAKSLNDALAGIGAAIQSSGISYQAQEDETAGSLSTIHAALG